MLGADHGLSGAAGEGFAELGHVGDYAIDAVFLGRMRIGDGVGALAFGAFVAAGPLRHADEEALIGRQAVDGLQRLILGGFLPGDVSEERSAQIGGILA